FSPGSLTAGRDVFRCREDYIGRRNSWVASSVPTAEKPKSRILRDLCQEEQDGGAQKRPLAGRGVRWRAVRWPGRQVPANVSAVILSQVGERHVNVWTD